VTAVSAVIGCSLPGAVDCVINVLSEECGDEIAGYIRTLASQLLKKLDCTERKR